MPVCDTSSSERDHQLLVAAAKRWFLHPTLGVVSSVDPLPVDEAERIGLAPLFLYAVNLAGTSSYWISYSAEPRPLQNVLDEAWRKGTYLRGPPDRVLVNREVMRAAAPLKATLAAHGIALEQVDPHDRRHPQCLRAAQDRRFVFELGKWENGLRLEDLNRAAAEHHKLRAAGQESVLRLAERTPICLGTSDELDWAPGEWLWGYEATATRRLKRCFHQGLDGRVTLLTGEARQIALERRTFLDEYASLRVRSQEERDRYWNPHQTPAEGVGLADLSDHELSEQQEAAGEEITISSLGEMIESWPNSVGEIARAVGATAQALKSPSSRLDLDPEVMGRLLDLLGYPQTYDDGYCFPDGPCVLIARRTAAIVECYGALSRGGDLEYAFEVVPDGTPADPSYRYLLLKPFACRSSVIMIPRGHQVTADLRKHFINCESQPQLVSPTFYRELQGACARACLEPGANIEEMLKWTERFEGQIEELRR